MKKTRLYFIRALAATLMLSTGCGYDRDEGLATVSITFDNNTTYFADGITEVTIQISIPEETMPSFRQVTLFTDAGTFENGDTAIILDLRLSASAATALTLGAKPGTYQITAQVGSGTTSYQTRSSITLEKVPQSTAIQSIVLKNANQLEADGQSEASIAMQLGIHSAIRFQTEYGTLREFGGAPMKDVVIQPSAENLVTAIFTTSRSDTTYTIVMESEDKSYDTAITFHIQRAYANDMVIELPKAKIDSSGEQIQVTAKLLRTRGEVSTRVPVTFTATRASGEEIGYFNPPVVQVEDTGNVETQYIYDGGEVNPGEVITITASTPRALLPPLEKTRTLTVIKN